MDDQIVKRRMLVNIPPNVPRTIVTIVTTVWVLADSCGPDGLPGAVAVGTELVGEGNRELL